MAEATDTLEERIKRQQADVDKLKGAVDESPSSELKWELNREIDRLRHMINSTKGNPKERSDQSAERARIITLNRAVQQVQKNRGEGG